MKTEIPVCKCLLPTGIGDFCDRCGLLTSKTETATPSHSEEKETTGKHTPTPWKESEHNRCLIVSPNGESEAWKHKATCQIYGDDADERIANAQLIVTAVNSYSTLKAENERLKSSLSASERFRMEDASHHIDNQNILHVKCTKLQSDNEAKDIRIKDLEKLIDRMRSGRDYLMQVSEREITVTDTLVAFGYGHDGLQNRV